MRPQIQPSHEYETKEKMLKAHNSFLEALKATYPIAFLSSLSIAIAAFLRNGATAAEEYAILAGVFFSSAFLASLFPQLFPEMYALVFFSFILFVMGLVHLYLVSFELSQRFSLIASSRNLVMFLILAAMAMVYWRHAVRKRSSKKP